MSKEEKKNSDEFYGRALIFIVVGVVILIVRKIILTTVIPWFAAFYVDHFILMCLLLALIISIPIFIFGAMIYFAFLKAFKGHEAQEKSKREDIYLGRTTDGIDKYMSTYFRKLHTHAIGTTFTGKTECVILRWAIDDVMRKRGLVIIDGKSDRQFRDKLYAYVKKHGREKDFRFLSLVSPELSNTFNPLSGGTVEEIVERVFSSFTFEKEYYKDIQRDVFEQIIRIFEGASVKPTFLKIYEVLCNPNILTNLASKFKDQSLRTWAKDFAGRPKDVRDKDVSGLKVKVSQFAKGQFASIFNAGKPEIDLEGVLNNDTILYCQLPVQRLPHLGKATAQLILQTLQAAISKRQDLEVNQRNFFSVYLDDFTEYLYPGFVTLLNKSRSANVGIVFAHQALGDIEALGPEIASGIKVNSNIKIIMRSNDPDTAEYFARMIGTNTTEKFTERKERGILGASESTGQLSARVAEEYKIHPTILKTQMGLGDAIITMPTTKGTEEFRLKLAIWPDLPVVDLPKVPKAEPIGFAEELQITHEIKGNQNLKNENENLDEHLKARELNSEGEIKNG